MSADPGAVPRATYRVQLHAGFTFDDVAAVAPYLADLGVSHVYCSPYLQAAPGSTHGYDVVDPSRLNHELGGEESFERMVGALASAGLGQVLDVVPNHMAAVEPHNAWWWDVLENGPASRYAEHFDIDWDPPERKLRATVLVPVLEDHVGRVIDKGLLQLRRNGGRVEVEYHDRRFPVSPRSLDSVLGAAADRLGSPELATLAASFGRLPHAERRDSAAVLRRHRDKEVLRGWLERLCADDGAVAEAVDDELARIAADPEALDDLLARQNYRLAYWRVAGEELDYRRFFDIQSLIGLRVEDERVFADTHEVIADLVARGVVTGLRIDHPDGLRDPRGYLTRLRDKVGPEWLVVEKILEPGEHLPDDWPVDGTTGYDALNLLLGLFVDPSAEAAMTAVYRDATGEDPDYEAEVGRAKREILDGALRADLYRVTAVLASIAERHRNHRDYTRRELRSAVAEMLVSLDVYRTYVRPGPAGPEVSDDDMLRLEGARQRAEAANPDTDPELFRFLTDLLLLRHDGPDVEELAARFQQLSGPVMAKGVEDTTFYRYLRFVALNEVGGDPGRFGVDVADFHDRNAATDAGAWPASMVTTSTHDHKRGEDVRIRLALLSEIPDRWAATVADWSALIAAAWAGGRRDPLVEYLFFQIALGAHPLDGERATAYMEKAIREAKRRTSWTDPDPDYEVAVRQFVERALGAPEFVAAVDAFARSLGPAWIESSLAQAVLKLTMPGVPDTYQGTELWDLSLVDPDNRRPVDYDLRRRLLAEVRSGGPEAAWRHAGEGGPKLLAVHRALQVRRDRAPSFAPRAGYLPLSFRGEHAQRAVGFVRGADVAVIVPRLALTRGPGWNGTEVELPAGPWTDVYTGAEFEGSAVGLDDLLGTFPVAVLVRR